jgi:hypothetical protein
MVFSILGCIIIFRQLHFMLRIADMSGHEGVHREAVKAIEMLPGRGIGTEKSGADSASEKLATKTADFVRVRQMIGPGV